MRTESDKTTVRDPGPDGAGIRPSRRRLSRLCEDDQFRRRRAALPAGAAAQARAEAVCAARRRRLADHADRFQGRGDRQRLGARARDGEPALTAARAVRRRENRLELAVRLGCEDRKPCAPISILCAKRSTTARSSRTAPAPACVRCSGGRSASISPSGFPLVTTKRLHLKSIVHELIWFLRGDTNIAYLKAHGVSIWDEWADADRRPRPGLRQAVARVGRAGRANDQTRSPG